VNTSHHRVAHAPSDDYARIARSLRNEALLQPNKQKASYTEFMMRGSSAHDRL